ncbi:ExbD/TolR family protein [Flavobacterium sp. KACC 22763]|nr:biopolymer transporter ExbD [Flavobacterium sp. KACC 22763]WDF65782.1 biopolymer transporter ExbD [Flavobacterium sp. KACC 22763]
MKNLPQKVRSRKLNSKVDLTAMVSVSFLLIIFFMVVGELSKPKIMELYSGRSGCGPEPDCNKPDDNLVATLLLDKNNKIITYHGLLAFPIQAPKETNYGKYGIRQELMEKNKMSLEYSARLGRPGRGITVIIKPTQNSNYGNLVDILDEMRIANITSYAIVPQFTPEESKLLASN